MHVCLSAAVCLSFCLPVCLFVQYIYIICLAYHNICVYTLSSVITHHMYVITPLSCVITIKRIRIVYIYTFICNLCISCYIFAHHHEKYSYLYTYLHVYTYVGYLAYVLFSSRVRLFTDKCRTCLDMVSRRSAGYPRS